MFLGALAVRVLFVLSIHRAFFFDHLLTEAQRYASWAAAIGNGQAPLRLPLDEAIGYPYLVAAIFKVSRGSLLALALVQAVVDAATCVALALLARRLGPAETAERRAWVAGLLAAATGPFIYFTGQVLPATVLLAALAWALVATPDDGPPRRWWVAGLAWAATLLVRTELGLGWLVVLVHAARRGGRGAVARVALPVVALIGISATANWVSSRHLVLLTVGSGVNLFIGNNAHADGVNPFLEGPLLPVVNEVHETARDPVEADRMFRARALAFVRAEPAAVARLALRKLAWSFTARELPNTSDAEWEMSKSWLFHPPLFPLDFGALFALALVGVALGRRALGGHGWVWAPFVVGLGTCVIFFTNGRFRLPLALGCVLLAAVGLDALVRRARDPAQRRRALLLGGAAALAGVLVTHLDPFGLRDYSIAAIDANTASVESAMGDFEGATRHLARALARDPNDPSTWIRYGFALDATGRVDEERAHWTRAQERFPDDLEIRRHAARFRRRHRQ